MNSNGLDFATRDTRESIDSYGARALSYVLANSLVGMLDDEALEQADRVSVIAVSAREVSQVALSNLSAARTLILRELDARKSGRKAALLSLVSSGDGIRPQGGAKVPVSPVVPVLPPDDGAALELPAVIDSLAEALGVSADEILIDDEPVAAVVAEVKRPTMAATVEASRASRKPGQHTRTIPVAARAVAPVHSGDDLF